MSSFEVCSEFRNKHAPYDFSSKRHLIILERVKRQVTWLRESYLSYETHKFVLTTLEIRSGNGR